MTRARRSAGLAMLAGAACLAIAVPARPRAAQEPTFRATTDAVWVTATVVGADGHLVTDLTKDDFEIRADGVVRPITVFRNDTVPFSLMIMFDLSGSMFDNLGFSRRAISELVQQFQPGDRANIGTFTAIPFVNPRFTGNQATLERWVSSTIAGAAVPCAVPNAMLQGMPADVLQAVIAGGTAAWDALVCAINEAATDAETPRRVALIVSDGVDHLSEMGVTEAIALANKYGVMVYAIGMLGSEGGGGLAALHSVAEATGGGYDYLDNRSDLPAAFGRIADELRHQFVLGFAPGSDAEGEHHLEVRALRDHVTTHARRVYVVTKPVAAAVAAPPAGPSGGAGAASPTVPPPGKGRTFGVEGRLDRYERGVSTPADVQPVPSSDLRRALSDFRQVVPAWVGALGPEREPRRRLAAATFALELLSRENDMSLWHLGQPASDLLEWVCGLLRDGPPHPAERLWYYASLAPLERYGAAETLMRHLAHASDRFPDDPRWVLARAIAADLPLWPERRDEQAFQPRPDLTAALMARYTEAIDVEPVRQEALVRLGVFEFRRGKTDEALADFDRAGAPTDPFVAYTLQLFRGRALERASRTEDAITAYRHALEIAPYAQSAALSLGAALVEHRQPREAAVLVNETMAVRPAPFDPWTLYVYPDVRFWPDLIDRLKSAVRR